MSDLSKYRKKVDESLAMLKTAKEIVKREQRNYTKSETHLFNVEEAMGLLQIVAQQIQQRVHDQIAAVVSRCLEAVFDDPYEFRLSFEQKRGRTEAKLSFIREGMEISPMDGSGGGVIDVASFALRLACLMLTRPPGRRLVILDEPFKFVSEEYRERVKVMLEELADELGVQFVMVTHIDELQTGTVIEIG